jgi:protease-4
MLVRIACVLALTAAVALAKPPTSRPASRPAKDPAAAAKPTTAPFTTPGEIIARMKQLKQEQKALPQVAYINLNKPIIEAPPAFSLFSDPGLTLQSVLQRIADARQDQEVRAVLLTIGQTDFNLSQAQEIRSALVALRNAGKRVFVYSDSYDTAGFVMASGATDVCMLEGGELALPGVGIQLTFAKGLLELIGVRADYVQIGEYKGADEQFTRTGASKELRGELTRLVDSLYRQIVDGIAHHRNIAPSRVEELIDQALIPAKVAKENRLVDHLVDMDGLRDLLNKEMAKPVNLVHDYGLPRHEGIDWSNPFALFALLARKPEVPEGPAIALIYAQGMIVDGEGGEGLLGGQSVGSEDIRRAFRLAARDPKIKAIVLRIDSPGGSALASEAMWQAARRAAREKPLIVSIGSMAASGGYYLACAGDKIIADSSAIVGSIGVVGGKFVMQDLYEKKLGLHTESFLRGRNADLFSSTQPFTDAQRRLLTNWMKQTYDQFTDRVMTTRHGKIKDIDQVARGRIFLAKQAMGLGMVDQLGGINDAIALAATEAKLADDEYEIRVVPAPKTLIDLLRGDGTEARLPITVKSELLPTLKALRRSTARLVDQQMLMMRMLQDRPVMLVSPYVLQW